MSGGGRRPHGDSTHTVPCTPLRRYAGVRLTCTHRTFAHAGGEMTLVPDDTAWPDLPLDAWRDTFATLHLWTQIVGKVRLAQTPWLNHSWHVALYVTARGLTTVARAVRRRGRSRWSSTSSSMRCASRPATDARRAASPSSRSRWPTSMPTSWQRSRGLGSPVQHPRHAQRDRRRDPLRGRPDARVLRRRRRADRVLARAAAGRPRASRPSAPASSARPARCTSSGAASTWP